MAIQVNAFFTAMAEALEFGRKDALQALFSRPAVFVTEGEKQVCLTDESIQEKLSQFIELAARHDCYRLNFDILQLMTLAEDTYFAQVNWQWLDQDGMVTRERISAFTIHDTNNEMSVVVCVLDAPKITSQEKAVS